MNVIHLREIDLVNIFHLGTFCKRALIPVNTPQGMKDVLSNVTAKPSDSSCGPVLTPNGAASSGEEVSTDGDKENPASLL